MFDDMFSFFTLNLENWAFVKIYKNDESCDNNFYLKYFYLKKDFLPPRFNLPVLGQFISWFTSQKSTGLLRRNQYDYYHTFVQQILTWLLNINETYIPNVKFHGRSYQRVLLFFLTFLISFLRWSIDKIIYGISNWESKWVSK